MADSYFLKGVCIQSEVVLSSPRAGGGFHLKPSVRDSQESALKLGGLLGEFDAAQELLLVQGDERGVVVPVVKIFI